MLKNRTEEKQFPKLSRFYSLVLFMVALTAISGHFLIRHMLEFQTDNAEIVNISGRQRMLSQRISLLVLQLADSDDKAPIRANLQKLSDLMLESHIFLSIHDESDTSKHNHASSHRLGPMTENRTQKKVSDKHLSATVHDMYFQAKHHVPEYGTINLDDLLRSYLSKLSELLAMNDSQINRDTPLVQHITQYYPHVILPILNEIVFQYEYESNAEIERLQYWNTIMLVFILIILTCSGFFIFRPMELAGIRFAKELQALNRELEKSAQTDKLAALGKLSGGIAHEINNALQPIIGLSDILIRRLEKLGDEQAAEYMGVIADSGLHAKQIVSSILSFARNQGDQFEVHPINSVAEENAKFIKKFIPESAELTITGLDELKNNNSHIKCDKTAVTQVVTNLVKNAVDATNQQGHIICQMSCGVLEQSVITEYDLHGAEFFIIRVEDNGDGMSQDVLDKVFDPFFTTKEEGHGTGLGLSVCYGIVQNHNGAMLVESTLGIGSIFTVILPLYDETMHANFQENPSSDDAPMPNKEHA